MFAPENEVVATVFLLLTMCCWGSWSSVRVLCQAEAPVFVIFYVVGQFVVGTALGLTLGMVSIENSMFNRETFLEGFTHPGEWYRVAAIFVGGVCCANSDFLAACACTRLPFAVVVPIFMGWALMQATVLNFLIEGGDDTNPLLLFGGVVCAFFAICCMALSDAHAARPETQLLDGAASTVEGSQEHRAMCKSLLVSDSGGGEVEDGRQEGKAVRDACDRPREEGSGTSPWIFVSIFSGFLAGLWSPLSTFGRSKGSYPVDNPSVALFFFQLGSLSSIPLMLWYYGRVIETYEKPSKSDVDSAQTYNGTGISISSYVREAMRLPRRDQQYGVLAGGIVSCGTYTFFTASQAISSTIAFAICSCAPLVTIAIGVIIFKQLQGAPFLQSFYLILSTLLFISAIALMVLANSI